MRNAFPLFACTALLLAAGSATVAGPDDAKPAAPDLAALAKKYAPAGWTLATAVKAKGLMTYSWQVGGWQPRGAVADLTNVTASGASAADRSGATYPGPYGPTWDFGGDRLVLQTSEKIEGGSPDHVDWARICVRTVTAQGTNGGWSYLLMVDTFGGKPPTPPAGAAAAPPPQGAWTASPFSCTYLMLMPAATPR